MMRAYLRPAAFLGTWTPRSQREIVLGATSPQTKASSVSDRPASWRIRRASPLFAWARISASSTASLGLMGPSLLRFLCDLQALLLPSISRLSAQSLARPLRLCDATQVSGEQDLPEGVQDYPGVGWPLAAPFPEWNPIPVPVGRVHIPRTFHTLIVPGRADDPHDPAWALTLMYAVEGDDVLLAMALAGGEELPELLERVRKLRPLRWWQRRALRYVAADEAERAIENMLQPSGQVEQPPAPLDLTEKMSVARDWLGPGRSYSDWHSEVLRAAQTVPLGRRRGRITAEHLEEVARVYRQAWKKGVPPTAAVAEHFNRPHSTAADWVYRARRAGVLGESDGTRGGETS